jgi:hypothetical protein
MTDCDDGWGYASVAHVRALRLMLASLSGDWDARDGIVAEIGNCPACWRNVALQSAAEAASAYVVDQSNPGAMVNPENQAVIRRHRQRADQAVRYVSHILVGVLDERGEA